MSTAIVSAEHINVILEAATREADEGFEWFAQGKWWTFTRNNRDRIGQLMLDASWDTHPIHLMMQKLRKSVITRIDGYDDAEWLI